MEFDNGQYEFNTFLGAVKEKCQSLPLHQVKKLKSAVKTIYQKRFNSRRKCRLLKETFTDAEFQHFLRHAPSEKFRLLFQYQAVFGLRAGEVCKLNVRDFDFCNLKLKTGDPGRKAVSETPIPSTLFEETLAFIEWHRTQIAEADGFIFFKDRGNTNSEPHISKDYLRNVFRSTIKKANMDSIYEYSNESAPSRKVRALHRLTTKSLCSYAQKKLFQDGDIVCQV